ncbi:MAG: UDP-glucuronate decarboxylase, partial [Alphaproteobacteria bacterium]|nr:UDP-glucuronate decarboxylase [Alphaproteobacteria bacterium]
LIEAFQRLMATADEFTGPVNLGNPVEFTIAELAELVRDITNTRSTFVTKPLPVDDPKQRCPDIALARKVLNWQPLVPLRVGLERTVAYFSELLAGGKL